MALPPVKICVHCPSFPQLAFAISLAGMMQQDRIIQTSQNSFLQSHSVFNLTLERSPSYCIHYKHTVKVNFCSISSFQALFDLTPSHHAYLKLLSHVQTDCNVIFIIYIKNHLMGREESMARHSNGQWRRINAANSHDPL